MSEAAGVLPYNLEAEEHVVGACIIAPNAIDRVAEIIDPHHINSGRLRSIYTACLTLHDRGESIDQVILAEHLDDDLVIQKMREIAAATYTASNVAHHARIVRDHATRRDLIRVGQHIAKSGWEPPDRIEDALGAAEQLVYDLTTTHEPGELRAIGETLEQTFQHLDRPAGEITGTATELTELDRLTAGLQPGNLVVIAARPGVGKSALALQIAYHAAVVNGHPAAVFSLEMSAQEINQRLLAIDARVQLMRIRTRRNLTAEDREALNRARIRLETAPLYVDDTVSARLIDIRARARRLKARQPTLACIVVDYLQLMLSDEKAENRNVEVANISRGLKLLARELDVPVIALAQLNRNVEHRGKDATPMLADLRDSGAIEQDGDVVVFIHRSEDDTGAEIAHLTVAKHRNGPTGEVKASWLKNRATFANLAPQEHA